MGHFGPKNDAHSQFSHWNSLRQSGNAVEAELWFSLFDLTNLIQLASKIWFVTVLVKVKEI